MECGIGGSHSVPYTKEKYLQNTMNECVHKMPRTEKTFEAKL